MNKILKLGRALHRLGLYHESVLIVKIAGTHGVMTLGYSESAAKIINEIVGDKWDYVIAKWIFDSLNFRDFSSVQDYFPGFSSLNSEDIIANLKAADGCRELMNKTEEERLRLFERRVENKNINNLYFMCKNEEEMDSFLRFKEWKKDDLEFFRMESSPTVDQKLSLKKELLENKAKQLIKEFISQTFISDVISNSWLPAKVLRKFSYNDAVNKWSDDKTLKLPTVLEMSDGWKWVDAGNGRSDWVKLKLKNCGMSSWGNLIATPESKKEARMLVLLDPELEPHGIATWNPSFKETEESEPKKYLGAIEAPRYSVIKDEYYPYVLELINYLNPDEINISQRAEYFSSSGRKVDNENLRALIDPTKLTR